MPVRAPAGAILFFAPPKKSIQKKGGPAAALILRAEMFGGGCLKGHPSPCKQRAASLPHPFGLIPPNIPVLGAAEGKKTLLLRQTISTLVTKLQLSEHRKLELPRWRSQTGVWERENQLKTYPLLLLKNHQITGRCFIPFCRAEHRGFCQELPAGVRQGCRTFFAGAGKPLRKTPDKSHGAQG